MNEFEKSLVATLGSTALARLQAIKIGIAGTGGLGSNCAQLLVRSGFKNFKLIDFDSVEFSNLNRQFFFFQQVGIEKVAALKENLLSINPDLAIDVMEKRIDGENVADLFTDCQAVIEALDRPEQKRMLVEAYMNSGKLLVAASGLAGWGKSDNIKTRRFKDNFYIVGDLVSEVCPENPAMAPGVVVTAAKQADIVLSYFLGHPEGGVD